MDGVRSPPGHSDEVFLASKLFEPSSPPSTTISQSPLTTLPRKKWLMSRRLRRPRSSPVRAGCCTAPAARLHARFSRFFDGRCVRCASSLTSRGLCSLLTHRSQAVAKTSAAPIERIKVRPLFFTAWDGLLISPLFPTAPRAEPGQRRRSPPLRGVLADASPSLLRWSCRITG